MAGSYSAALAAAYAVFKDVDPTYAAACLAGARQLYDFANNYRGKYSDSVPNAASFYFSYAYEDELTFAAAMLAYVTNENGYKTDAQSKYNQYGFTGYIQKMFDWDNKQVGIHVSYTHVSDFCLTLI